MKAITLRDAAIRDVDEAAIYYTDEAGWETGERFVAAVESVYRSIAEYPGLGARRYEESLGLEGLRARRLDRFPYLVFYIEQPDRIDIWRVLHAQRDIPATLGEADI